MALPDARLIIHNPFILADEDLSNLKLLGTVAAIVMPNCLHGDETGWMAEKLPDARVFVPAALKNKLQKKHRVDATLENDWPSDWESSIACLPVEGLRFLVESVFFHRTSRTLVLTDLVFNMKLTDFKSRFEGKLMSWNRVGVEFGPSLACNIVFTRDKVARRRSVEKMLEWDFERVIMNHGHVVETDGKALLRSAFLSS